MLTLKLRPGHRLAYANSRKIFLEFLKKVLDKSGFPCYNIDKKREKKGIREMKKVYNLKVKNTGKVVFVTWENYAFGKEWVVAPTEKEAFEKMKDRGWAV